MNSKIVTIQVWSLFSVGIAIAVYRVLRYFIAGPKFIMGSKLTGKIIIVTGGNSGIGKVSCEKLAEAGAEIVLAARNPDLATKAVAMITLSNPGAKVVFMQLDLASFDSIRKFADAFKAKYNHLDVLVNNAGLAYSEYSHTNDGFELQTGTNHLGHFLLTYELLPLLLAAPEPRVVTVSSEGHRVFVPSGKFDRNCFRVSEKDYSKMGAYGQSKLANILFAKELQRRTAELGSNLLSFSLHPGTVATEVARHMPALIRMLLPIANLFLRTPLEGAQTTLFAVCAPELASQGGAYLADCRVKTPSKGAQDAEMARLLWEDSEKMCGITPNKIAEFSRYVKKK